MSYNPKNKSEDSLNQYFTNLAEFNNMSYHLLNSKSAKEFELWFEQAELIDKRALFLFLKENADKIPIEYLEEVQFRFDKILSNYQQF